MNWAEGRHELRISNDRAAPTNSELWWGWVGRGTTPPPPYSPTPRWCERAGLRLLRMGGSVRGWMWVTGLTKASSHLCLKHVKPGAEGLILLFQLFGHSSTPVGPRVSMGVQSHQSLQLEIRPHITQRWVSKIFPCERTASTNICHPLLHSAEVILGDSGPPGWLRMPPSSLAGASGVMEMGKCTWGSGDMGREGNRRAEGGWVTSWHHRCGSCHHCFFDFSSHLNLF